MELSVKQMAVTTIVHVNHFTQAHDVILRLAIVLHNHVKMEHFVSTLNLVMNAHVYQASLDKLVLFL